VKLKEERANRKGLWSLKRKKPGMTQCGKNTVAVTSSGAFFGTEVDRSNQWGEKCEEEKTWHGNSGAGKKKENISSNYRRVW